MTTHHIPARSVDSTHRLTDNLIYKAKQYLVNASLDVEQYRTPEFRLMEIRFAIDTLNSACRLLETQVAIENAKRKV